MLTAGLAVGDLGDVEAYLARVWIPCSVIKFAVFCIAVDEVMWKRTLYVCGYLAR